MSEHDQPTAGDGIDHTGIVHGPDGTGPGRPGMVDADPSAVRLPERVDFGIDALGQWTIEVRADDGTLLDLTDDGLGNQPLDLAAYPTDNPVGAVELHAELTRRFPDSQFVWRPGVMNSLDEATAAAHRALAAAAKDRKTARAATDTANASLRKALPSVPARTTRSAIAGVPPAFLPYRWPRRPDSAPPKSPRGPDTPAPPSPPP